MAIRPLSVGCQYLRRERVARQRSWSAGRSSIGAHNPTPTSTAGDMCPVSVCAEHSNHIAVSRRFGDHVRVGRRISDRNVPVSGDKPWFDRLRLTSGAPTAFSALLYLLDAERTTHLVTPYRISSAVATDDAARFGVRAKSDSVAVVSLPERLGSGCRISGGCFAPLTVDGHCPGECDRILDLSARAQLVVHVAVR